MDTVIKVENLSKKYIIGHQVKEPYQTLRDTVARKSREAGKWLLHPFLSSSSQSFSGTEEFWALKDVSFEVQQGDRLGIIGRNGAGKSTLLKILSRITEPTKGRISIKGRVASLLEVGTGFHPELTGRENIFLNGAILGMGKAEIKKKFDEIVAFAEVEKFLDTPVKHYSSGMYVRLAFAVAAHLEPEILIIDEVLAVGDLQFQKKCLGKMEEVGKEGRTVLFVSHNMATISALCNKGMLFDKGNITSLDSVEETISNYMQHNQSGTGHQYINKSFNLDKEADLYEVCAVDTTGMPGSVFLIDQPFSIRIAWQLNISVPFMRFGIDVIDHMGIVVLSTMDTDTTDLHDSPRSPGLFNETVSFPPFLLMPGVYFVKVFAVIPRVRRILEVSDIIRFEILENNSFLSHVTNARRRGYISTPLKWTVNHTND